MKTDTKKIASLLPMKNVGLRTRALLISSLPVILIGFALAGTLMLQRFDELDKSLENQGKMIAAAFSHGIFESMTQRQGHTLPFYAQRILEEDNVRSVAIYDTTGKLITQAGPRMHPLPEHEPLLPADSTKNGVSRLTDTTLRVIHPIYPASSYHPLASDRPEAGWLEVEVDRSNLVLAKYRNLLSMLLVISLAVVLNTAIAVHFSASIGRVVSRIKQALAAMTSGNLDVRVEEDAYGELKELQAALNHLGQSILEGQQELQQNVDQATEDLRETLETIEIQNIELDLARKEALEASRIKSEFLANMSHEIRTPLNGIIGFTNLLLKSDVSLTQRDYLDTIQKSSESLLAIINDILDFSKIEAGKLVLDQVPLNFQEVVEDVLTMLAPMAHEKHLEQVSLFYSDVPTGIVGDPLRLKQILTNLVNNAIKFTDHGEIVVRVMLDDLKDNSATIKVSVSDTGIGLTKEQQRALFSAFRQADTTTARRFGGTGLGLVISKHLVEQMRGEVGLESEPGQGSTFWFTFRAEIHNADAIETPLLIHQRCRIAIYDSNATVRANLKNTLQKRKVEVIEFSDFAALTGLLSRPEDQLPHAIIVGINAQHPLYQETVNLVRANQNRIPLIIHANPADQSLLADLLDGRVLPLIAKPLCQQKAYDLLGSLISTDAFQHHRSFTEADQKRVSRIGHQPLRVIAVDDNAANLKLLTALLEDLDVLVTACDSGIKALQHIEQREFDLVLMDIQMPVMDGVEAARRIRIMEKGERRTPIIAVTAHALASEKHQLLNSGMDDYVTKPINESQLIHIIHKWTGVNLHQKNDERGTTSAEPGRNGAAVDMQLGIKLANGKADLAEEMLDMLFTSLQKDKSLITERLADEDYGALLEVVHKLHGATRYTGVPKLQKCSFALEEALKLQRYETVPELTSDLMQAIDQVVGWYVENRVPVR